MLSKIQIAVAAAALSLVSFGSSADPRGITLNEVVSFAVTRAINITAEDIATDVYAAIANANHHFSLDAPEVKTQVLISNADHGAENAAAISAE